MGIDIEQYRSRIGVGMRGGLHRWKRRPRRPGHDGQHRRKRRPRRPGHDGQHRRKRRPRRPGHDGQHRRKRRPRRPGHDGQHRRKRRPRRPGHDGQHRRKRRPRRPGHDGQHRRKRRPGPDGQHTTSSSATWTAVYTCLIMMAWIHSQSDGIATVYDTHTHIDPWNITQHHSGTLCTNETQTTSMPTYEIHTHSRYIVYRLRSSGDVHSNPGPVTSQCRICSRLVRWNQRGITCDGCDFWHHAKCVDMPATEYVRLSDSPEYWHCRPCTLPPFSDSFFNSTTSTLGLDLMTESFDMSDGANTANDSAPDTELTSNTSDGDDEVRLFPELRQLQDQFIT